MVKAPVAGRVKTRLGTDIGMTQAAWWYRHQTAGLIRRLRDRRWRIILATANAAHQPNPKCWPYTVARMNQGPGDLGQRMKRLLARFSSSPAVLIGSDIPSIEKHHIACAFRVLAKNQFVFGPSMDGGFWLVGAPRINSLPSTIFENCRWSTEFALNDAERSLSDKRRMRIATLRDVDDVTDLMKLGFTMTIKKFHVSETYE